jgi:hypothetical protein
MGRVRSLKRGDLLLDHSDARQASVRPTIAPSTSRQAAWLINRDTPTRLRGGLRHQDLTVRAIREVRFSGHTGKDLLILGFSGFGRRAVFREHSRDLPIALSPLTARWKRGIIPTLRE